eukprot:scaffold134496_cov19-Prasinocladus_malaysianus.AAC.1
MFFGEVECPQSVVYLSSQGGVSPCSVKFSWALLFGAPQAVSTWTSERFRPIRSAAGLTACASTRTSAVVPPGCLLTWGRSGWQWLG